MMLVGMSNKFYIMNLYNKNRGGLVIQYEDDYDYSEPTYFILNKSNTPVHFV